MKARMRRVWLVVAGVALVAMVVTVAFGATAAADSHYTFDSSKFNLKNFDSRIDWSQVGWCSFDFSKCDMSHFDWSHFDWKDFHWGYCTTTTACEVTTTSEVTTTV